MFLVIFIFDSAGDNMINIAYILYTSYAPKLKNKWGKINYIPLFIT